MRRLSCAWASRDLASATLVEFSGTGRLFQPAVLDAAVTPTAKQLQCRVALLIADTPTSMKGRSLRELCACGGGPSRPLPGSPEIGTQLSCSATRFTCSQALDHRLWLIGFDHGGRAALRADVLLRGRFPARSTASFWPATTAFEKIISPRRVASTAVSTVP